MAKEKAAERGVPSLVWRAGQERRLEMIRQWGKPEGSRVLVDGCGVGMYVRALLRFTPYVVGLDIEVTYLAEAARRVPEAGLCLGAGEHLPFPDGVFDMVLSHEVIEHVADDRMTAEEMVRVLRPGGRALVFCPNRLYPFETHGHYWRGKYHFGNTPLINYLPNALRNRLAPHVRAYTAPGLRSLFDGLPVRFVHHTQVYPGFDNVVHRWPTLGKLLRKVLYAMEETPLRAFGISHFLVVERT
jgi:SAM-dependent methyltransferase